MKILKTQFEHILDHLLYTARKFIEPGINYQVNLIDIAANYCDHSPLEIDENIIVNYGDKSYKIIRLK